MTSRTVCNFKFLTSLGGRRVVRIPDPIANITAPTAISAAGRIVDANPFDETVGNLVDLKGIDVVTTTVIPLF